MGDNTHKQLIHALVADGATREAIKARIALSLLMPMRARLRYTHNCVVCGQFAARFWVSDDDVPLCGPCDGALGGAHVLRMTAAIVLDALAKHERGE